MINYNINIKLYVDILPNDILQYMLINEYLSPN